MLRVGLVGLGYIGLKHAIGWRGVSNARVTAIMSRSGKGLDGKFTGVAGNIPEDPEATPFELDMEGVTATTDWDTFLANCDAVDICLPVREHARAVNAAISAGKHVLCEKPGAITLGNAQSMLGAARSTDKVCMLAHCMHFWPGWAEVPSILPQCGKIHSARLTRVAPPPEWGQEHFLNGDQTGGGQADLGFHDLALALDWFGVPNSVSAFGSRVHSTGNALDDVTTVLSYDAGHHVTIETSWARTADPAKKFGFDARFEIRTEKATITGGFVDGLKVYGLDPEPVECPQLLGAETGWANQLRYFSNCIADGTKPRWGSFEEGLQVTRLFDAAYRAARSGQPQSWGYVAP